MPAAELVKPFRVLPEWRLDDLMIFYSVPGGGVEPHIDNYDVFIIQGMSRRRWRVGDALLMRQFCSHPALLHVDSFEPIIDVEMAPGDILYIPSGFPHDGFTFEDTMNYSIGFRGPTGHDLLSSFVDYALEQDLGGVNYGDPDLTVHENAGSMENHEIECLRAMMIEMINRPGDFEQWLGRLATTPCHELDIAPLELPYQLEEMLSGLRVIRTGEHLFVNIEGWITTEIKEADVLCQFTEVGINELGEVLENPVFVAELTEFINQGYWYFEY